MNRTIGLILLVAAASGGLGFAVSHWQSGPLPQPGDQVTGQPLPPFSFVDLAGSPLTHESFAGAPLIVNLWATWCGPCVEEMPLLSRVADELRADGLQVLGVALDQPDKVADFLESVPVSYPVAITDTLQGMQYARSLGNGRGMLPYTVFIDRSGLVRHIKIGQLEPKELGLLARQIL